MKYAYLVKMKKYTMKGKPNWTIGFVTQSIDNDSWNMVRDEAISSNTGYEVVSMERLGESDE